MDDPTVRLFSAILAQSVEDLLFPSTINPHETDKIRREALVFLTATRGPNAEDRATICAGADLDPDVVRKHIVAILDGAPFKRPHGRGKGRVKDAIFTRNLAAARALWKGHKQPPPLDPTPRSSPRWPELILELLSGRTMTTTEIAERLGTTDTTMIHSVCTRLVTQRRLTKTRPATFTIYIDLKPEARIEPESIDDIRERSERILAELESRSAA